MYVFLHTCISEIKYITQETQIPSLHKPGSKLESLETGANLLLSVVS